MNKTSEYEFTIIVPVYNEQDNISNLGDALSTYLPKSLYKACVLFVNDGSKDDSLSLLRDYCQNHSNCFYISFQRNAGLSAALKAGIDFTQSQYLGYMDADLQTAPEDFNLLLKDIKNNSMVISSGPIAKTLFSRKCNLRLPMDSGE